MATVDLWPDEIADDGGLEGPTVLLKEQAALLGQKTKNLVEAEVITTTDKKGEFIDEFKITSSSLNYQYILFYLRYPLEFFPATIFGGNVTGALYVDSREDLEDALSEIFSNERTIKIIQALIARSRG